MRNKRYSNNLSHADEDPPPYHEIGFSNLTAPSAPPLQVSSPSTYTVSTQSSSTSGYNQFGATQNQENDVFQKPKFLLYPSPDARTQDDQENGFSNGQGRPLTNEMQISPHPVAPYPSAYQSNGREGVTLSASHLPPTNNATHVVAPTRHFTRYSQSVFCPNCRTTLNSHVTYTSGQITHLACIVAFWFTCCLCCIPYFISELKDVKHTCPQCKTVLGYCRRNIFADVRR